MNFVYKYLRHIYSESRTMYLYYELLARHHEKTIMKHCKTIEVWEAYERYCVKELPLKALYKNKFSKCKANHCGICLECWIDVLERYDDLVDKETMLPSFLQQNRKQNTRNITLLKQKGAPKCLK